MAMSPSTDGIDLLVAQHRALEDLLDRTLEATDPETGEALAHLAHARGLQLGSDIVCQADNKCPAKVSERAASRASPEASVSKLGAGQPCA